MDIRGRPKAGESAETYATEQVDKFLTYNWPFGSPFPVIWFDPRTAEHGTTISLHAKCIVVDERTTLVTSAKFTDRGQTRNLEVGALIEDPRFAREMLTHWRGLSWEPYPG